MDIHKNARLTFRRRVQLARRAFSVSVSKTASVAKYIRDQEKHHRKMTFEQEYNALLRRHGIGMPPS
jgi:putative transposase